MKRGSNILSYFSSTSKRVKSNGNASEVVEVATNAVAVEKKTDDTISSVEVSASSEISRGWPPLQYLNSDWHLRLQKEFSKPYFRSLTQFLDSEFCSKEIYPPQDKIFNAFNMCSFESIKVVILGQDPYHGPNQVSMGESGTHKLYRHMDCRFLYCVLFFPLV